MSSSRCAAVMAPTYRWVGTVWSVIRPRCMPRAHPRRSGSARGDVLCVVPRHLCALLGCGVNEGVEPSALPFVHQQETGLRPPGQGLVHASATTTCCTSVLLFQQIYLPVGALDPNVELTKFAGHVVGLATQLGNGQGGQHL